MARRWVGAAWAVVVVCTAAIGLVGCTGARPIRTPAPAPEAIGPRHVPELASVPAMATIARLIAPASALSTPDGRRTVERLQTTVRPGGGPTELLVLDRRTVRGTPWLRVRLPERPNGSSGWIDANDAVLSSTPWRIVVSTERRTLAVFWNDQEVRSYPVVVGAPSSPTPHGLFAVEERIPLADPVGFFGSWILTLTAHSTVYQHFDGGDGQVAIHGRGGSSLLVPLGTARSHGCVRMDNPAVAWLARVAGPGTPVEIV